MRILVCISLLVMSNCQAADDGVNVDQERLLVTTHELENLPKGRPFNRLRTIVLKESKCSGNKKLTAIPILNSPRLAHLSLIGERITAIPQELSSYAFLKTVILSENLITSIPKLDFPCLEKFVLNRNYITTIPDNLILEKLKYLFLSDNQIHSIGLGLLDQFPELEHLDVSGNPIIDLKEVQALREATAAIELETGRHIEIVAKDIGLQNDKGPEFRFGAKIRPAKSTQSKREEEE